MKLREIYSGQGKLKLSFEVFPPIEDEKFQDLINELEVLKQFNPEFISLTWGAGGKNNKSSGLIEDILNIGLDVMPHFTCVCSTKDFVESNIKTFERMNIDKILALRGDIPENKTLCSNEFKYANELVEFLKSHSKLSIGVAGYPEGHVEAKNIEKDIHNLKKKVDAGADVIFTQLFFDCEKYFKYCELVRKCGINIPIIPGIMPILSKKQIDKMTNMAKITIPDKLQTHIEKYQYSKFDMQKMGIEYISNMCEKLINNGVLGLHFFTLNKSKSTKAILENII